MAAQSSHQTLQQPNPEVAGIDALSMGNAGTETLSSNHGYGVYVLEGVQHPDGSSGLIFSFNPNVLPIKDSDTSNIATNIRRSLLPLKRKEKELKVAEDGQEISAKDLTFRVEANEAPIIIIRGEEILDGDSEEAMELLFSDGEETEGYTIMHGWPAVRLDYDTSLMDHASVIKAVGYVIASNLPPTERHVWMEDFSGGINVESLLDRDAVRPGNPNRFVRGWLSKLLEEREAVQTSTELGPAHHTNSRFSRIATSLSSLIKV